MTFDNLATLFISWGWVVPPNHYESFKRYLHEMLRRKNVLIIWDGSLIEAVIFFFITNDYSKTYKKGIWDLVEDVSEGRQVYIDKLVCKQYTLNLRRKLQNLIEDAFPGQDEVHYLRAPRDRHVIIKRRGVLSHATV